MSTAGMTTKQANDFMALEPRLVELLKAALAGLSPAVHVLTAADLGAVAEARQLTPAVHVIYGGYRIEQDLGLAWRLQHTWYAVVVVKHAAQLKTGSPGRQSAGQLAATVVQALAGAVVSGAAETLTLITPPAPSYAAPYTYLPTAIHAVTHFRKSPTH